MKKPNSNIMLDKRQVIILAAFLVMFLVVIGYWQVFYLPKSRQISAIKAKLTDFDINIKEEEAKIKTQDYEVEIAKIQQEVKRLQAKFPSQNELPALFQEIFNLAKKFNIQLVSVEPDKPTVYTSKSLSQTDLIFNKVPLKLKLQTNYRSLAEFLRALFENSKYAFSFDDLQIRKGIQAQDKLEADLLLGAFVLSYQGMAITDQALEKKLNFLSR